MTTDMHLLTAPQFLVSPHEVDDLPEPYIWDEEVTDARNLTRVTMPRGAPGLPPLPDLYPGREYFVANSLEAELRDFNQLFPKRSRASDGWLGNASHAARRSDHNPDYGAGGIIRAGDLTTSSWGLAGGRYTAEQRRWHQDLIADIIATEKANPVDRLWYLIHWIPGDAYPKIWSRSTNWEPRRYTGPSPHDHHWHTSIMRTNAAAGDTKRWFTDFLKYLPPVVEDNYPAVSLAAVVAAFGAGAGADPVGDVRDVQHALNAALPGAVPPLVEDGYPGRATTARYADWQRSLGYTGADADGVPGQVSLSRLPLKVGA